MYVEKKQVADDSHNPGQDAVSGPDFQILGVLVVPYKMFDQKVSHKYLPLTVRRGAENICSRKMPQQADILITLFPFHYTQGSGVWLAKSAMPGSKV